MLTASLSAAQEAGRISVIVGASSPITQIARTDVVRIFLGQAPSWADGMRIWPVDQSMTSRARKEFSSLVLKQSILAVDNYWRKQIFAGRATPPRVMDTEAAVVQATRQAASRHFPDEGHREEARAELRS
jgi:hypothetical protein